MLEIKPPELIERNITESMYECVGEHDWIEHQITGIRYYYGKNTHLAILISQCRKCYSKKVETWKTHYWYEIIKLEKVDAEPSTETIQEKLKRIVDETQDNLDLRLELLAAAFLQETGLKPSECELVQDNRYPEIVFYFRKRVKE